MIKYRINHIKNRLSKLEVILLGNGPSLWRYDPSKIFQSRIPTIGINASWKFMRADYHCTLDKDHVRDYFDGYYIPANGYIITSERLEHLFTSYICSAVFAELMPKIPLNWEQSWKTDLALGGFPQMTGLFAIQLAIYMGAQKIWLLGFDSIEWRRFQHRYYHHAARMITKDRPDIEIYNCNRLSLIKAFPRKEKLEWLKNSHAEFQDTLYGV